MMSEICQHYSTQKGDVYPPLYFNILRHILFINTGMKQLMLIVAMLTITLGVHAQLNQQVQTTSPGQPLLNTNANTGQISNTQPVNNTNIDNGINPGVSVTPPSPTARPYNAINQSLQQNMPTSNTATNNTLNNSVNGAGNSNMNLNSLPNNGWNDNNGTSSNTLNTSGNNSR